MHLSVALSLEAGVLGTLFVRAAERSTAPSAPKMLKVLATLIVYNGQVVSPRALIRELWDDEPPASAVTTLQTYILNTRKLLAELLRMPTSVVARDVLVTKPGGYALRLDPDGVDVHQFMSGLAESQRALASGDDKAAICHLSRARELWRGPAFVDVPMGQLLKSKSRQLEESRILAVEFLVEALLRLGRYREAIGELITATAENPLHENLHGHYMYALHRTGRRAQALDVFRRLRVSLVTELGLEPGTEMQQLHREILTCSLSPHETSTWERRWPMQVAQVRPLVV